MNAMKRLSLEFDGFKGEIEQYTSDSQILNACEKLADSISKKAVDETIFFLKSISDWYSKNQAAIQSNNYVMNPETHIDIESKIKSYIHEIESGGAKEMVEQSIERSIDARKVFVVHGRNAKVRESLFSFLRAVGVEPMEFSEAKKLTGEPSPYIFDILKKAFENVQAVVVLFTPDDVAKLDERFLNSGDLEHDRTLTGQARQNVIFEAGMAFAMFQKRTILVQIGSVRPFSDISGVHFIRFSGDPESRHDLVDALENAGVEIDYKGKRDWLSIGDFSI